MATTNFIATIPVLSSADLTRDTAWYEEKTGFRNVSDQEGYAIMQRDGLAFHLQWHHGTEEDPVLPGVVRIWVKGILPLFEEFVHRGTVSPEKLRMGTSWGTNEFGFYDLNRNAIFVMEDVE
ncbi:MAG: glyoxalase/bleomycin resistance/extradiol dioxygenase family protein [Bacteroidota bacterium]